jgi:hypothetical protein
VFEKKAKENMLSTQNNNQGSALQKSSKQAETVNKRDELSKISGVSHDTYNKGKKVLDYSSYDRIVELNERTFSLVDYVSIKPLLLEGIHN